jgi:FkbM family methyltransferase
MHRLVAAFCRASSVPLSLRRKVGRYFLPLSGERFTIEIDGLPYSGTLDNYVEWVAYLTGEFYEYTYLNLIRSLRLGGTAVDVGANVGNHTVALSRFFDRVVAIEPFPPVYQRLLQKTAALPGVVPANVAFGEGEGRVGFAPPEGSNFGTGKVESSGELCVEVIPGDLFLSRLLPEARPGEIRFIKVDVEGYEAEVLRGLKDTLSTHRPAVLYEAPEFYHRRRGLSLRDSFALFPEGYRFFGLRGQTTFPVQRRVARPVPLTPRNDRRRYACVLAVPAELPLPLSGIPGGAPVGAPP